MNANLLSEIGSFSFVLFIYLFIAFLYGAGVDPFSRRAIWDLLIKKKKDRVIILTTHFMVRL